MPEDFTHRRATATDALPLSTLAAQAFLDTYATQGINDALAREVATVYAAEVFRRYVQRPFLRRGLGRDLMARAEVSARALGPDTLWLTAWASHHRALALAGGAATLPQTAL